VRYWWVNQNQTYSQEIGGGYLWSPKRKSNGSVNPFYESMREVSPGDVVLSFADTHIVAMGLVMSHCYECPKPAEFGLVGSNWSKIGWKIDVRYVELSNRIRPVDYMDTIRRYLPQKYSPLSESGRGRQSVYLAEIPSLMFESLANAIGKESRIAMQAAMQLASSPNAERNPAEDIVRWEEHLRKEIERDQSIPETEKQAIVLARRGQGLFRKRVTRIEARCRITNVSEPEHLRASHCKPWRDCSNDERLDGENGLLMTPSIDHLFDRGFISFESNGRLLISPVANRGALQRMGIHTEEKIVVGQFTQGQRGYLSYHRDSVFLRSRQIKM
jgi:putative restriction endonuclease